MKLYLRVTKDRYELPLAVAESQAELSRMLGMNKNTVGSAIRNAKKFGWDCIYKEVEVEDD